MSGNLWGPLSVCGIHSSAAPVLGHPGASGGVLGVRATEPQRTPEPGASLGFCVPGLELDRRLSESISGAKRRNQGQRGRFSRSSGWSENWRLHSLSLLWYNADWREGWPPPRGCCLALGTFCRIWALFKTPYKGLTFETGGRLSVPSKGLLSSSLLLEASVFCLQAPKTWPR